MNISVRKLDADDNAQLLALARAVDTSGGAFRVERGPDFFALTRVLGDSTFYGAFAGERLVGCVGLTRQRRYLDGQERVLDYLHDVRVHPDHRGSQIFPRIGKEVRACCDGRSGWAFGTILDTNDGATGLRAGGGLIGTARPIGRTVHLGIPLLLPRRARGPRVVRMAAAEAWSHYVRLARLRDFAPADAASFAAADGDCIGLHVRGRIVGIAKVVDQNRERRIVATRAPVGGDRLLARICRALGVPSCLHANEALPIAYVAYRAAERGVEDLDAILAHLAASERHRFSHAFVGLSEDEAARRRDRFALRISSTTFAFGVPPEGLSLAFHELTLV